MSRMRGKRLRLRQQRQREASQRRLAGRERTWGNYWNQQMAVVRREKGW